MGLHDEVINCDPFGLEPLVTAGQVKVLRQSTLGTADTCLHRLTYDLDPSVRWITGERRAIGTAYHAGLEWYYEDRKANGFADIDYTPDAALLAAIASFDYEAQTEGYEEVEGRDKALARVERLLDSYFRNKRYWPENYEVLATEWTFLVPLVEADGKLTWVAKGTVDLLLRDENGWIIVVDHKTANKKWDKQKSTIKKTNQHPWYVHWVRTLWGTECVIFVYDITQMDLKWERRPAPVEEQHIAGTFRKVEVLTQLIDQGGPYPPNISSFLCSSKWCDHWDRCPFGEAFQGTPVEISITIPHEEEVSA